MLCWAGSMLEDMWREPRASAAVGEGMRQRRLQGKTDPEPLQGLGSHSEEVRFPWMPDSLEAGILTYPK